MQFRQIRAGLTGVAREFSLSGEIRPSRLDRCVVFFWRGCWPAAYIECHDRVPHPADEHPDFALSPMLRAAQLTLGYAFEHDSIRLTATRGFKRDFVHWAVEHFDWPGKPAAEVFRHQKFVNEADFPPLELLHFLLIRLRLGRHYKGTFRVNNVGRMFAAQPAALFDKLVPFFLLAMDHAAYSRTGEDRPGNWDTWLNVMNVEI